MCAGGELDTSQEGHAGLWRGDAVLLGGRPDVFSNTVSSASRCYFKTQGAGLVDAPTGSAFSELTILKKQPFLAETALIGRFGPFTATHLFCEV